MCALFGWLDYKGIIPYKILKKLTQALANAAEERGTDAAGIAYVKDKHITICKYPKAAHRIRFHAPDGTRAVMGHTRFATQGDKRHNYNNHPFYEQAGKKFALAHNGVLYNDTKLRAAKNLPATHIETDSYIAVQLIENQSKLNFSALRNMAEDVLGSFVFTILDEDNSLWFVKGDNPLYLLHFPELCLYVYTSTASIMADALHHTPLLWMHYVVIEVEEGDIIKINSKGKMTRDNFRPSFTNLRFGYTEKTITSRDESYTMLIDMCGYYGVAEEDIIDLMDMGYSYDEIEEFLMNPSLLDEGYFCSEL